MKTLLYANVLLQILPGLVAKIVCLIIMEINLYLLGAKLLDFDYKITGIVIG